MLIVYQTYRNADMNEGRGPMVPDLTFINRQLAEEYIDAQPGIQGRKLKWSQEKYGDWEIKEIEALDSLGIKKVLQERMEKLKKSALRKLTADERKVLGL